jgi:uncharacterized protein
MSGAATRGGAGRRAYWLKTLHQWHWISSALCLIGMLLFSITGVTLNHATQIEARAVTESRTAQLPGTLRDALATQAAAGVADAALPGPLLDWLSDELDLDAARGTPEWSPEEIYVSMPRPGGDGWIAIDLASGAVEMERTDRGWISYFNDLHKGRNTGAAWSWFIDVFALACLVFCATGLFLLQMHARQRSMTWPMVGAGLVIPLLLALLLIH